MFKGVARRQVRAAEKRRDLVGLTALLRNEPTTADAAAALSRVGGSGAIDALLDSYLERDFPGDRAALERVVSHIVGSGLGPFVRPKYLARDGAVQVQRLVLAGDLRSALALLGAIRRAADVVETETGAMVWGVAHHASTTANRAAGSVQQMQRRNRGILSGGAEYSIEPEREDLAIELVRLDGFLATLPDQLVSTRLSFRTEGAEARRSVDRLVRLVEKGGNILRREAIDELCRMGDPAAIPALCESLNDPDPEIRYNTLTMLTFLGGPPSINDLSEVLEDPLWVIRNAAVAAMRGFDGESVNALRARLDDDHVEVQMTALALAAEIDREVLRQGVVHEDGTVRAHTAQVAGALDDPRSSDVLAPLLTDSNRRTRLEAGRALNRWKWGSDRIAVAIAATDWETVVGAGVEAAEPLLDMFLT